MERKIKFMMLAMSVILLTVASAHQVSAQNRLIPVADTGVITLEPNQVLRVFVAVGDVTGDGVQIRFSQMSYETCQASPKLCIAGQTPSGPIALKPTEAAFVNSVVDAADYVVWRTIVMSNRRGVKVTAIVFDTSTQRIVTQIIVANTEGDIH